MQAELPAGLEENLIGILQKCRQRKNPSQAWRLLAFMGEQQLESHPLLGNHLVPLLVDCGRLPDAQRVFDRLPLHHRNQYSWNSMISAYVDRGNPQYALHLYRLMQEEPHPVAPTRCTFLTLLNACSRLKDAFAGQELHNEIICRGLEKDILISSAVVGNTLVGMYSKCGLFAEARGVLDSLPLRDGVSWNALIAGYARGGLVEEAGECLNQMQLEDITPDNVTFVCCLKACGANGALGIGRGLHIEITKRGLERDVFEGSAIVGNTLVDMYTKCGLFTEGHCVFDGLPVQNEVSWNVLIAGSVEQGRNKEALDCFERMQLVGVPTDPITFVCCLKACGLVRSLETGHQIHAEIFKKGLENDIYTGSAVIGNTLVDMYTKCGSPLEACHVFDGLPVRSAVSWNTLIAGFAEQGLDEDVGRCFEQMQAEGVSPSAVTFVCSLKACAKSQALETGQKIHAEIIRRGLEGESNVGNTMVDLYSKCRSLAEVRKVFDWLPVKTVVSWNALMTGYSEQTLDDEVLTCFKQMQLVGMQGNSITFLCCLKACGTIGALETGREIHAEVRKSGLEGNIQVGSMLIDMYSKCGSVVEGEEVFAVLPLQDVVAWTAMIKAYGENHESGMAIACFKAMQEQGLKPDALTFTCLLAACSHGSLVIVGQEYFKMMREEHRIAPTMNHFACMVDLFARSGQVHEAEKFIAAMQCPPSGLVLMALLSACKIYGKVQLGERCFEQLVEMDEEVASGCLLMEEIYASAGRWNDANSVEEMRKHAGAKKKPGSAFIEVDGKAHGFLVGTNQRKDVSEWLHSNCVLMRHKGYVPSLDTGLRSVSEAVKEATNFEIA